MSSLEQKISNLVFSDDLTGLMKEVQNNKDVAPLLTRVNYQLPTPKSIPLPKANLSVLHLAAFTESTDVFLFLVQSRNMSIVFESAEKYTPLQYAIINKSLEIVYFIWSNLTQEQKAKYNKLEQNKNIIYLSCYADQPKLLTLFLEKGANLNDLNSEKKAELMTVSAQSKSVACLEILLQNITDRDCLLNALSESVFRNEITSVRTLLKSLQGAKTFSQIILTNFKKACSTGRLDIAAEIAPFIDDINLSDDESQTPLHIAISTLSPHLVRMILQKSPKFEQNNPPIDSSGKPPAHLMAYFQPGNASSNVGNPITNGIAILNLLKEHDYPFLWKTREIKSRKHLKPNQTLLDALLSTINKRKEWICWLIENYPVLVTKSGENPIPNYSSLVDLAKSDKNVRISMEKYDNNNKEKDNKSKSRRK